MLRNQPIKRKLMTVILLTSGVVLLLACGTFLAYELLTFRQAMVRNLSTLAQVIAANSTAALAFDNRTDATEVLSALSAEQHIVAAGLYDDTGTLFARYPDTVPDGAWPARIERDGYQFARAHFILQEPVVTANRRLGTLVLKSDLGAMYERLPVYGGLVAVAIGLSCLVALPLSNRLQRHVSLPVLALADTARAVSMGKDYSVRAGKFGDDELGRLTDAFNDMLAQIQGQDSALRAREEHLRREVAERMRAEEEVRALNASLEQRVQGRTVELAQANKELESFSYSVSHDLRAPLRHVQGYVEMLHRATEGQLSEQAQRYLKTIMEASVEMGQLIDDLLAFSRMGRIEMTESRVPLDEVVQNTIRGLEMATTGRNIVWQTAPLPPVVGDPSLLKQVLANLIGNAVKYSRSRDPGRIEIGCAGEEDGRIILYVRDNGAGFDMQYAHKLFGVFQRLHRAEEFEGTGIGLATVRRIVARHGGRVWAEGAVNQGATFYVTLKRSPSA
jgi:signal transduction histidine kinase